MLKEITSSECAALFALLAPNKHKRLKLNILDTVFVSPQGFPVSRFYTNENGVVKTVPKKQITSEIYFDFAATCSTKAAEAAPEEDEAVRPVAIARYRDKNALLTRDGLNTVIEMLTQLARGDGEAKDPEEEEENAGMQGQTEIPSRVAANRRPQIPWCLQSYVPPKGNLRYISTYMWADSHIACENYQADFSPAYPTVQAPPTPATLLQRMGPPDIGVATEVPTVLNLSLRKTALAAINFIHTAHSMQLLGLVVEFIMDQNKNLILTSTMAICWPDKQVRYRDVHPEGRLFCTIPMPVSASTNPSTAQSGKAPSTAPLIPSDTPPRPSTPPPLDGMGASTKSLNSLHLDLKSAGLMKQGGSAHTSLKPDQSLRSLGGGEKSVRMDASSEFGTLPYSEKSGLSALTDRSDTTKSMRRARYGLESGLSAMITPRYSDRYAAGSVWSSHINNPAQEVLNRSAAALVNTGKGPPTYAPYHHTRRCCQPALVVDLTRRLEEVRLALQQQQQQSAEANYEALRWSDAADLAEKERQAAVDNLAMAIRRHEEELARAKEGEALYKARFEASTTHAAELTEQVAKLTDENEELKKRLDYERHVSFDMTGDLKTRLTQTEHAKQQLNTSTTSQIQALMAERDALKRDLATETTTAKALASQLATVQDSVEQLKQEAKSSKESVTALSRERDELLRALPGGFHEKGKAPMFAPEEIEDLLLKEQNPVAEFNIITRIFSENAIMLRQVFRYYASIRDGPGRNKIQSKGQETISQLEFHKFCRECGVTDKLDSINIDQVFIKVNFQGERGSAGDRVIVFTEFLESLLRLSHMRYQKNAHLSQSLQEMLDKNIPNAKRSRTLMPSKQMMLEHEEKKKKNKKKAAAAAAKAAKITDALGQAEASDAVLALKEAAAAVFTPADPQAPPPPPPGDAAASTGYPNRKYKPMNTAASSHPDQGIVPVPPPPAPSIAA
mmetsp:Transcript_28261/g.34311  ORF Transcript_28261/g.34311 Transcript_28261/m.34311 type:complete len:960 (-) Transcript_28261:678-3557(-)